MNATGADVAIIILNHNGWAYTVECLESLGHLDYQDWWAVVVDNGSTDDSVERIRAWARGDVDVRSRYVSEPGWPKPVRMVACDGEPPEHGLPGEEEARLVLIRLPENRGFAGGNNVAIRYALRRGVDWTWLLNNDTVVAPDALSEMLKLGESDPCIGVVGSKLLYYHEPRLIQAAGGGRFLFWAGVSRSYGQFSPDEGHFEKPFQPHYVSGACMLVRARLWEAVGLLDESFFFYTEEVDWQLRVRKKTHWRTAYCPRAKVYHREGGTAGRASAWAEYWATRSNMRLSRRYAPCCVPSAVLVALLRVGRRLLLGELQRAVAVLRGVTDGLRKGS